MKKDYSLRDYLAIERTNLANERTLLAYWRTSFAFLTLGLFLIKFFEENYLIIFSIISMIFSAILFAYSLISFEKYKKKINK